MTFSEPQASFHPASFEISVARAKVLGQALIGPVESHAHPYPVTVERGMFTSHGPALGHILTTTARIRISVSNCMD